MKALDLARVRSRAVFRALGAAVGRSGGWGRLVLRLDDLDAPRPGPASTRDLAGWQEAAVDRILEGGAVPVEVIGRPSNPLLVDLARFVARLDCPVTVRTEGAGLDQAVAEGLVGGGVRRIVLVGESTEAVRRLDEARRTHGASLDLVVEVPVGTDLDDAAARMRGAGADGIRVGLPWAGGPWDPETLAWFAAAAARVASFDRTDRAMLHEAARMDGRGPGAARRGGHCAVGGARLEVGPDGAMYACPHQGERAEPGGPSALVAHRALIRACERVCVHPALAGPAAR